APQWGEKIPELPLLIHDTLQRARDGRLQVNTNTEELQRIRSEMRRANRRTVAAIVGGTLVLAATLIMGLDGYAPTMVAGVPLSSWVLGALGVLVWLTLWLDGD